MPEYIDIHSHISFPDYNGDREAVIGRMKEKNIWTIDVGVDLKNSKMALKNAEANKGIFASAGLHPTDNENENFNEEDYRKLFESSKVVAVGECGLDYFRLGENNPANLVLKAESKKERQKNIFKSQVDFALELDRPLMVHCRDAYADLLEILRSYSKIYGPKLRGNMHFFAGDWKEAKKFLDLGFTLSFTGVITFARNYDEVIKNVPISMIMAETDSPFVTPVPHRGEKNEPSLVVDVVKKISEIRNQDFEATKEQILKNSFRMFDLK